MQKQHSYVITPTGQVLSANSETSLLNLMDSILNNSPTQLAKYNDGDEKALSYFVEEFKNVLGDGYAAANDSALVDFVRCCLQNKRGNIMIKPKWYL